MICTSGHMFPLAVNVMFIVILIKTLSFLTHCSFFTGSLVQKLNNYRGDYVMKVMEFPYHG